MKYALAIAGLLLCVGFANAQCGAPVYHYPTYYRPSRVVYSAPTYHAPVHHVERVEKVVVKEVLTPVAIPVAVPVVSFQYLPALQPQVQTVPVTNVNTAAPQQQQQSVQTQDIDRVIRERVEAILREKFGATDRPPALVMPGETQQQPAQASTQELIQNVANLLARRCSECHTTGTKTSGDVSLFTKQGDQLQFSPTVSKQKILEVVAGDPQKGISASMPPIVKKTPSAGIVGDELKLLQQWVATP